MVARPAETAAAAYGQTGVELARLHRLDAAAVPRIAA